MFVPPSAHERLIDGSTDEPPDRQPPPPGQHQRQPSNTYVPATIVPSSDMSHEGGDAKASREAMRNTVEPLHADMESDNDSAKSRAKKSCWCFTRKAKVIQEDTPKCQRGDDVSYKKCCGYCKTCFNKLLLAQRTMNLATGDTS